MSILLVGNGRPLVVNGFHRHWQLHKPENWKLSGQNSGAEREETRVQNTSNAALESLEFPREAERGFAHPGPGQW